MLSGGPWAQIIVEFEPRTRVAFEAFLAAECRSPCPSEQFGILPDLSSKNCMAASPGQRADRALGIEADETIKAVALFSLGGLASNKSLMRLYIGVAQDARRKGMGTALFMRCVSIARQAGVRYLVIEDLEADAVSFARFASAELIFVDGECQAWIEIGPPAPTQETARFSNFCLG
jgi:GNAT superfamily N-acetyltransferase